MRRLLYVCLYLLLVACDSPGSSEEAAQPEDNNATAENASSDTTIPVAPDPPPPAPKDNYPLEDERPSPDLELWFKRAVRESVCLHEELSFQSIAPALRVYSDAETERLREETECIAYSSSCEFVLGCLGYVFNCDPDEHEGECVGNKARNCESLVPGAWHDGWHYLHDQNCDEDPDGNNQCFVDAHGKARCGVEECFNQEKHASCEDERRFLSVCSGDVRRRTDCGRWGKWCSSGAKRCELEASYDFSGEYSCNRDGESLVHFANALEAQWGVAPARPYAEYFCSALDDGSSCQEVEWREHACGNPPSEHECTHGRTRCQGSVAQVCTAGAWRSFDCGEFDGSTCKEDSSDRIWCANQAWTDEHKPQY